MNGFIDPCVLLVARRNDGGSVVGFGFADANDSARSWLRAAARDPIGADLFDILPASTASGVFDTCCQVVETGETLALRDYAYAPVAGCPADARFDVRAVRVGDGVAFTWRAAGHHRAEAMALAETERRYRMLAELASDVVAHLDPHGRIAWISPSVERSLGWHPAELLGTDAIGLAHPDHRHELVRAVEALLQGEHPGSITCRFVHRDGTSHWMNVRVSPLVEDGRVTGAVVGAHDVDAEVRARQELEANEFRYRLMVENATDAVAHVRNGVVLWVSPSLTGVLGWQPDDWAGSLLDTFVHPDDRRAIHDLRLTVRVGERRTIRTRVRDVAGDFHWVESNVQPYLDRAGDVDGLAMSFRVIDTQVAAEFELQRRARYDELTGLLNRREALDRLDAMHRIERRSGESLAVLFCDIDRFKQINDRFGHAAGDTVLRTAAERITAALRSNDMVARIGGDEILVILSGVGCADDAVRIAEDLRRRVAEPIEIDGERLLVTMSVGLTIASADDTEERLVGRADDALYRAKAAGRDRVATLLQPR